MEDHGYFNGIFYGKTVHKCEVNGFLTLFQPCNTWICPRMEDIDEMGYTEMDIQWYV